MDLFGRERLRGGRTLALRIHVRRRVAGFRERRERRYPARQGDGSAHSDPRHLECGNDVGEEGRFGNQLREIPLLQDLQFGFGPLRFSHVFPQDPHNVFLSAFASFGWVGGLGYLTSTGVTIYLGWVSTFRRSRLQPEIVALWSSLLPQILQGVQIDAVTGGISS